MSDRTYLLSGDDDAKPKGWSISQKYEAIIVGDPYCGKSTFLNELIKCEREANAPISVSDDNNKLEFWVEYKTSKAIFVVRDTANQEKFRSLTQTHYRKAQCALIAFDIDNLESFYSLKKWYTDIFTYTNNQVNFPIVLIGIRKSGLENNKNSSHSSVFNKNTSSISVLSTNTSPVTEDMVDKFQIEHEKIIGYCVIDIANKTNIKEPFEILLKYYLTDIAASGRRSVVANMNYAALQAGSRIIETTNSSNYSKTRNKVSTKDNKGCKCCIL